MNGPEVLRTMARLLDRAHAAQMTCLRFTLGTEAEAARVEEERRRVLPYSLYYRGVPIDTDSMEPNRIELAGVLD